MKKILLTATVLYAAAALTSCNKEYTCRCKDHFGNKTDYPFTASSRNKAKENCEDYQSAQQNCDLIYSR